MLTVENLTYIYAPGTPLQSIALKNINLVIRRGEFFALVGATGSGKSTLAQHFNGLLLPTAGRVLVNGQDTRDKKVCRDIWRTVGLVFQFPEQQLFEETVFADVAFGPRNMGLERREVTRRVRRAMEMVGLDYETLKNVPPLTLSGGQRRRVALAGVLAIAPCVLVLDEPTAGLDPQSRFSLLNRIKSWQKTHHTTIVLITHNMEDVARLADRVAVLSGGELWQAGTPRQVFSQFNLHAAGLKPPLPVELMKRLKNNGFDLHETVLTLDEAEKAIKGALADRK